MGSWDASVHWLVLFDFFRPLSPVSGLKTWGTPMLRRFLYWEETRWAFPTQITFRWCWSCPKSRALKLHTSTSVRLNVPTCLYTYRHSHILNLSFLLLLIINLLYYGWVGLHFIIFISVLLNIKQAPLRTFKKFLHQIFCLWEIRSSFLLACHWTWNNYSQDCSEAIQ